MFQTNNPGAWSVIGKDTWVKNIMQGVQDPVCAAATAGDPGPTYQSVYELLIIGANYLKLDTFASLARSSDKMVTNLLSLAEGFTVQQLPPAVYIVTPCFSFSAICDIYY